jgi:hypothetical protein
MVELGTRCTTERVQVGNSPPTVVHATFLSRHPHATFCGSRRWVTAVGDPVDGGNGLRMKHRALSLPYALTLMRRLQLAKGEPPDELSRPAAQCQARCRRLRLSRAPAPGLRAPAGTRALEAPWLSPRGGSADLRAAAARDPLVAASHAPAAPHALCGLGHMIVDPTQGGRHGTRHTKTSQ